MPHSSRAAKGLQGQETLVVTDHLSGPPRPAANSLSRAICDHVRLRTGGSATGPHRAPSSGEIGGKPAVPRSEFTSARFSPRSRATSSSSMRTYRERSRRPTQVSAVCHMIIRGITPPLAAGHPAFCHSEGGFGPRNPSWLRSPERSPVLPGTLGRQSSLRSRQRGFMVSTSAIRFARVHALTCFSRAIASRTSRNGSKYTSRVTLYF
jgi:hypothetical protein